MATVILFIHLCHQNPNPARETVSLKKPLRVSRVAKPAPLARKHRQDATCHRKRKKTGREGKASNIMPELAKM
jgi:hypothetical protein